YEPVSVKDLVAITFVEATQTSLHRLSIFQLCIAVNHALEVRLPRPLLFDLTRDFLHFSHGDFCGFGLADCHCLLVLPPRSTEPRRDALFLVNGVCGIQQAVVRSELAHGIEGEAPVAFARVEWFGRFRDREITFHSSQIAYVETDLG